MVVVRLAEVVTWHADGASRPGEPVKSGELLPVTGRNFCNDTKGGNERRASGRPKDALRTHRARNG